jgi:hypothetical protein
MPFAAKEAASLHRANTLLNQEPMAATRTPLHELGLASMHAGAKHNECIDAD